MNRLKTIFFVFCLGVFLLLNTDYTVKERGEKSINYLKPVQLLTVNNYYKLPITQEEQTRIAEICNYYCLEPALIYKIIKVESNYNRLALSKTNDIGLMQINRKYFKFYTDEDTTLYTRYGLDRNDYTNIYVNIITGCNALAYWREHNAEEMLSHYNQGYNIISNTYKDKVLNTELETYKTIEKRI